MTLPKYLFNSESEPLVAEITIQNLTYFHKKDPLYMFIHTHDKISLLKSENYYRCENWKHF